MIFLIFYSGYIWLCLIQSLMVWIKLYTKILNLCNTIEETKQITAAFKAISNSFETPFFYYCSENKSKASKAVTNISIRRVRLKRKTFLKYFFSLIAIKKTIIFTITREISCISFELMNIAWQNDLPNTFNEFRSVRSKKPWAPKFSIYMNSLVKSYF